MNFKMQLIQFFVMAIVGICFNPMNMLAYRFSDLFFQQHCFMGDY